MAKNMYESFKDDHWLKFIRRENDRDGNPYDKYILKIYMNGKIHTSEVHIRMPPVFEFYLDKGLQGKIELTVYTGSIGDGSGITKELNISDISVKVLNPEINYYNYELTRRILESYDPNYASQD